MKKYLFILLTLFLVLIVHKENNSRFAHFDNMASSIILIEHNSEEDCAIVFSTPLVRSSSIEPVLVFTSVIPLSRSNTIWKPPVNA